jgi:hypothetical protein
VSERPGVRLQHPFTAMIAAVDGARIRGGCPACDAYMLVRAHAHGPDVHAVTVCHDRNCPELAAMKGPAR